MRRKQTGKITCYGPAPLAITHASKTEDTNVGHSFSAETGGAWNGHVASSSASDVFLLKKAPGYMY